MRVLVTGASGFVGSFVAARFAEVGHTVSGVHR
jgi:nucleoside-diphosphate-sugar epimerase